MKKIVSILDGFTLAPVNIIAVMKSTLISGLSWRRPVQSSPYCFQTQWRQPDYTITHF